MKDIKDNSCKVSPQSLNAYMEYLRLLNGCYPGTEKVGYFGIIKDTIFGKKWYHIETHES